MARSCSPKTASTVGRSTICQACCSCNGNRSITVFWPDGGNRVIFFEDATPMSFDQSEADGGAKMTVGNSSDIYTVKIGSQRFEIVEAIVTGG